MRHEEKYVRLYYCPVCDAVWTRGDVPRHLSGDSHCHRRLGFEERGFTSICIDSSPTVVEEIHAEMVVVAIPQKKFYFLRREKDDLHRLVRWEYVRAVSEQVSKLRGHVDLAQKREGEARVAAQDANRRSERAERRSTENLDLASLHLCRVRTLEKRLRLALCLVVVVVVAALVVWGWG